MNYRKLFINSFIACFVFIFLASCASKNGIKSQKNYFESVRKEISGNIAYETTAYIEDFWRLAGNTGFNKSIERITTKLEEVGFVLESSSIPSNRFTYRIEKRPLKQPTWDPIDASLSIQGVADPLLQFKSNRNMICINSSSTPSEGIIAEVIYVNDLEALNNTDVKGKIVFAEMSPYRLYNAAIREKGAIGILAYNNPDYLHPEKNVTSIQFSSIPYHSELKVWGMMLSYQAKERLKNKLAEGPVNLKVKIDTNQYPSEELTVIATIKGKELANESLVFSAHIQEPGANDNASGTGAQLEVATTIVKMIESEIIESNRSMTFIWGDEIISTKRFIEETADQNKKIKWGISLDMVGENTSITGGSFLIEKMPDPSAIWTRGNDKHTEWGEPELSLDDMKPHYFNDFIYSVFKEQGTYTNWEVNTNPYEGGSDHVPFIRANIPGLLLWHFTDQFYHTDNDRLDKVSKETLKNVTTAATVSALILVNANEQTALSMIDLVDTAAHERLKSEIQLSKIALKEGSSIEMEMEIILAWKDWYTKALASVTDMYPQNSIEVDKKIGTQQLDLKKLTESLIVDLNRND